MPEKRLNPEFISVLKKKIISAPYFKLLGMKLRALEEGRAEVVIRTCERHLNPLGMVQNGIMASVLDAACSWSFLSQIPDGRGVATAKLNTNFVDSCGPGQDLLSIGRVIKVGKRLGFSEARLSEESSGRLLAFATATSAIVNIHPSGPLAGLPPKFLSG